MVIPSFLFHDLLLLSYRYIYKRVVIANWRCFGFSSELLSMNNRMNFWEGMGRMLGDKYQPFLQRATDKCKVCVFTLTAHTLHLLINFVNYWPTICYRIFSSHVTTNIITLHSFCKEDHWMRKVYVHSYPNNPHFVE